MITARTDARIISLEEAIKRGRAYRDAGADFIFIEAPESVEEIRKISQELSDMPLVINMIGKSGWMEFSDFLGRWWEDSHIGLGRVP